MNKNYLTTLDLNKVTPYAVGFDRIFDDMFRYVENAGQSTGYPPYNIRKDGNHFQIEIALAGVKKADLVVTTEENNLIIEHNPDEVEVESDNTSWLHRGIATRKFRRVFTLSDDVVVNGAKLEDGMLYVDLERIIPDAKKPKTIQIK